MSIDINDINFDEIGTWPLAAKAVVIGLICVAVVIAMFWFDTRSQVAELQSKKKQELKLKRSFEVKQQQAVNLAAYQEQLRIINASLKKLINQLPAKTEVPELLENISKKGIATGLHFQLFDPALEKEQEFISELPIKISVVGNFHQFGKFISQIVGLSRIVTLHDFTIQRYVRKDHPKDKKGKQKKQYNSRAALLQMNIIAKTYRYNVT